MSISFPGNMILIKHVLKNEEKKKPLQILLKFEVLRNAHQQGTDIRRKVKDQNRSHRYTDRGVSSRCSHCKTNTAMWIVI